MYKRIKTCKRFPVLREEHTYVAPPLREKKIKKNKNFNLKKS